MWDQMDTYHSISFGLIQPQFIVRLKQGVEAGEMDVQEGLVCPM